MTILPTTSRHHERAGEPAELEHGGQVRLDRVVPVGKGELERRRRVNGAVAGDEHVEPAERRDRLLEAARELGAVGEVGADGDAAHARGRVVDCGRTPEQGDRCTRIRERLDDPLADSAAPAGDEGAPAREPEE